MKRRIPLWLKLGFTLWIAVWTPFYEDYYGWRNFLFFCDIANFVLVAALWTESSLLFSWQAVSVLLVQVLWLIDLVGAAVTTIVWTRHHYVGRASAYMFDVDIPIHIRLLSLFHVLIPWLLLWGVRRLGYHRRAFLCQSLFAQLILPLSWIVTQDGYWQGKDVNWVWGPFNGVQHQMPAWAYLLVTMVSYPIILYLPTHLFLRWFDRRPASVDTPGRAA